MKRNRALRRMSEKTQRFVAEYPIDYNGAAAVRRAGYQTKNPAVYAVELLSKPAVRKAIDDQIEADLAAVGLTRQRILLELSFHALRDVADLFHEDGTIHVSDIRSLPVGIRKCVDGVKCRETTDRDGNISRTIELKLTSKLAAVELVMRHLKMLTDKIEILPTRQPLDYDAMYSPADQAPRANGDQVQDPIERRIQDELNRP